MEQDQKFMQKALACAEEAFQKGEFPVGAVIEYKGKIVAEGIRKNSSESELSHSEIIALKNLNKLKNIDFGECTIYITLEPCLMCFGAILISGIKKIVYAYEDVMGGATSLDVSKLTPLYNEEKKIEIVSNVLRDESLLLFKKFFLQNKNGYLADTLLSEYTIKQK